MACLFFVLLAAAWTDWREGKICNLHILIGIGSWIFVTLFCGLMVNAVGGPVGFPAGVWEESSPAGIAGGAPGSLDTSMGSNWDTPMGSNWDTAMGSSLDTPIGSWDKHLSVGFCTVLGKGLEVLRFAGRMAVVCIIFYPLFRCRMIGAGDIKLMGLCVGYLGYSDGIYMLFLSFVPAAAVSAWKLCRSEKLWEKMEELAAFAVKIRREKRLVRYRSRYCRADLIPLGPCLLLGYCFYLWLC